MTNPGVREFLLVAVASWSLFGVDQVNAADSQPESPPVPTIVMPKQFDAPESSEFGGPPRKHEPSVLSPAKESHRFSLRFRAPKSGEWPRVGRHRQ